MTVAAHTTNTKRPTTRCDCRQILNGKDAERFNKKMKEAENNPISKTEYDRMMDNFNRVIIK
jgi:hypothetical protein